MNAYPRQISLSTNIILSMECSGSPKTDIRNTWNFQQLEEGAFYKSCRLSRSLLWGRTEIEQQWWLIMRKQRLKALNSANETSFCWSLTELPHEDFAPRRVQVLIGKNRLEHQLIHGAKIWESDPLRAFNQRKDRGR